MVIQRRLRRCIASDFGRLPDLSDYIVAGATAILSANVPPYATTTIAGPPGHLITFLTHSHHSHAVVWNGPPPGWDNSSDEESDAESSVEEVD